jgi:hypothetical protein
MVMSNVCGEKFHGYLYDPPYEQRVQNIIGPIAYITLQPLFIKTFPYQQPGYNKEQRHTETVQEGIDIIDERVLIKGQTMPVEGKAAMPKSNKHDANTLIVVDPEPSFFL